MPVERNYIVPGREQLISFAKLNKSHKTQLICVLTGFSFFKQNLKYKLAIDISPWRVRAKEWHMTDGRKVTLHFAEMLRSFVDKESLKARIKWDISAHAFSQPVFNRFSDEGRKMLFKVYEDLRK